MFETTPELHERLSALRQGLLALDRVAVAFSGGADSALLAWVAADTLGRERAPTFTAVSPSLGGEDLEDCRALAEELLDPAYRANDGERCQHCKTALMDVLAPIAIASGAVVALGVNLDDLSDHRPGQQVAAERGAVFPLVDAGFAKADVRALSRALGLRTWDKPAGACLASRVPYGTPVTVNVLSQVERGEARLHALGLRELRVRHHDDVARIELPIDRLADAVTRRDEIVAALRGVGYRWVALDLEGLRSGNLNQVLDLR